MASVGHCLQSLAAGGIASAVRLHPLRFECLQRRSERAQRNLLAAVKELCTVRKLLREAQARPLRQPQAAAKPR
jgi:hypothetical protein